MKARLPTRCGRRAYAWIAWGSGRQPAEIDRPAPDDKEESYPLTGPLSLLREAQRLVDASGRTRPCYQLGYQSRSNR